MTISLSSSDPALVKLPPSVVVPAGVKQVQVPMLIGEMSNGAVVRVTASGVNSRSAEVILSARAALVGAV